MGLELWEYNQYMYFPKVAMQYSTVHVFYTSISLLLYIVPNYIT